MLCRILVNLVSFVSIRPPRVRFAISIALEEDFTSFLDVSARMEDSKSSRELVDESRQILRRLDAGVQTLVQVAV